MVKGYSTTGDGDFTLPNSHDPQQQSSLSFQNYYVDAGRFN